MGLDIDFGLICIFAVGLLFLYLIGKLITVPIKLVFKLIINGLFGLILLLVFNFLGKYIGVTLDITIINALIAGFLGIPGVILLVVLAIV